jgi:hypothetical protein
MQDLKAEDVVAYLDALKPQQMPQNRPSEGWK